MNVSGGNNPAHQCGLLLVSHMHTFHESTIEVLFRKIFKVLILFVFVHFCCCCCCCFFGVFFILIFCTSIVYERRLTHKIHEHLSTVKFQSKRCKVRT